MPDEEFDQILSMGARRIDSERVTQSAMYIPEVPAWDSCRSTLIARQASTLGGREALLVHYAELLARSQCLVDFFTYNVGGDDDWPLMIIGDSATAEESLKQCVEKLRTMVGFLTEGC